MIRIEKGFFSLKKLLPVFVFGVFLLFAPTLDAQDLQQRQTLLRLSEEYSQRFEEEKAEAVRMADSLGLFVRKVLDDGRVIELMRFEHGMPVYYTTQNAEGAALIHSDKLYPGGVAGLSLTGAGQTLGVWDEGKVRNTHQEFMAGGTSRVTQRDGATSLSNHATHVAGTMIAGGVQAAAKGMSYEAYLDAYDWNNDHSEMATAAANGLQVSQHSYVTLTGWVWIDPNWHWFGNVDISKTEDYSFGFYDYTAFEWDNISHNAPNYLIIRSAGNDRGRGPAPGTPHYVLIGGGWQLSTAVREIDGGEDGYDCISHAGVAKNILTVGAIHNDGDMASFSSWGPSDDGRIKPDVVAKGVDVYSAVASGNTDYEIYQGTSMSGPMVSGSVGLLMEHQENLYPGSQLLASTIKALIIHSADDEISGAPGPDYRFGWGLMDTRRAAEIMGKNAENAGIHIHEITLNQGEQVTIPVVAKGSEPLRATMVWTDVPGTPVEPSLNPTDLMLVNDLDMRIEDPTKITHYPYILDPQSPSSEATTGDNIRDNVEMVHIQSPLENQEYIITINHKGSLHGGNQTFSLIITGNKTEGLPTVSTTNISAISQSTATSGGNVTDEGESDVITRGVVWGTNTGPNVFNYEGITIDGSGPGAFTSQLAGLVPETNYYVRAYATNNAGTAYGDELMFATLPFEDITRTVTFNVRDLLDNPIANAKITVQSGGSKTITRVNTLNNSQSNTPAANTSPPLKRQGYMDIAAFDYAPQNQPNDTPKSDSPEVILPGNRAQANALGAKPMPETGSLQALMAAPVSPVTLSPVAKINGNDGEWIHWDSGENTGAIGTNDAVNFSVASRWFEEDLIEYDGWEITHISFFPNYDNADYVIYIWIGGGLSPNAVYSQPVSTPDIYEWNIVELNEPFVIDAEQGIWFGYNIDTQGGHPAGCDSGPPVAGKGNMIYINHSWSELTDLNSALTYNWNIQAYVVPTETEDEEIFLHTDANGQAVADLAEGQYSYLVEKEGYSSESGTFILSGQDKTIEVQLSGDMAPPFGLLVETEGLNPGEALFTWNACDDEFEFRYDDGVVNGQLGFQGGTYNSVLGAVHFNNAILHDMAWYLTEEGGPHTTVRLGVLGLTPEGLPDRNNVVYLAENVANTDNQWNTYTFDEPIAMPEGFFIGLSYDGFLGLAADDGVGEPWDFVPGTQFGIFDITDPNSAFTDISAWGVEVNYLLRAYGNNLGDLSRVTFAGSKPQGPAPLIIPMDEPIDAGQAHAKHTRNNEFTGYNIFLNEAMVGEEIEETQYLFTGLEEGDYTAGLQSVYTSGSSEIVTIGFEITDGVSPFGNNIMIIHDIDAFAGGTITVELEIVNEDDFAGFNLDIPLPAGFDYIEGSVQLFRDDGHFFNFDILPGNVARMISAAIPTKPFLGNDGVIVSFDLQTPDEGGTYVLNILDAVIADAQGNNIMTDAESGTVTLEETVVEKYTLTITIAGNGSVEVDGIQYTEPVTVDEDTVLGLEAIAGTGWEFVNWTGDIENVEDALVANTTVTMPASDIFLTANFIETGIPENLLLSDETITDGETECFDALQTIIVSDFTVETGGSATLIAGHSIHLLPGTTVQHGGYLLARIAAHEDDYCGIPRATKIAKEPVASQEEDIVSTDFPHEVRENGFFKLYPNPTDGTFTLELTTAELEQNITVEVHSVLGGRLLARELPPQRLHSLSLEGQQPGMYIIRVTKGNKMGFERLIKR